VQWFERKAWDRPIDYLIKLPPLPATTELPRHHRAGVADESPSCRLPRHRVQSRLSGCLNFATTRIAPKKRPEIRHVHNDDHARAQFLLAGARAPVDVQPVHLGWRAAASQPSRRGGLFHEPQCSGAAHRSLVSIAVHLLGGAAILIGFMTRWAAALLILLCLGTAFGVHLPAGNMDNMMNFYKNLVMAGGFFYVINFGAGAISFDEGVAAR
jgi:uncharacterized membrane protein YphA (DoxX/SURF4 family)